MLIAIPSAPGDVRQKIVETCRAEKVPVKTLPGLHELIAGDLNLGAQIRPVQVEDVLGRQQVEVDLGLVATYVKDKTVLVTGAGGSIGSELCRQLARLGAARLVLVDKGESALFEIERELVDERDFTAAIPVLADSGDRAKMRQVFERYRPQVLFHAAAYKHVGDARGESAAGGLEQRARDAHARRGRGRVRRRAVRAHLDRQGGESEERDGAVEGGVRVDHRVVRAAPRGRRPASSRCASATCSARRAR